SGASSSTAVDSAAPPSPAALSASPTLFASKAARAASSPIADGCSRPSAASTPTRPTPPPARSAARRSPSVGKSLNLGSNGRISFIVFWQARPLTQNPQNPPGANPHREPWPFLKISRRPLGYSRKNPTSELAG